MFICWSPCWPDVYCRVPNRDQRIEYRVNPALQLNTSTRLAEDQCIESVQESQVWSQIRQSLQGIMACPSKRTRRTHGWCTKAALRRKFTQRYSSRQLTATTVFGVSRDICGSCFCRLGELRSCQLRQRWDSLMNVRSDMKSKLCGDSRVSFSRPSLQFASCSCRTANWTGIRLRVSRQYSDRAGTSNSNAGRFDQFATSSAAENALIRTTRVKITLKRLSVDFDSRTFPIGVVSWILKQRCLATLPVVFLRKRLRKRQDFQQPLIEYESSSWDST